jgi:hypothetical protein
LLVAGYSGTPLAAKLGIRAGTTVLTVDAPPGYRDRLVPVPDGVAFKSRLTPRIDIIHVFSTSRRKLGVFLGRARRLMRDDAAIWVSWPKKAAAVPTDVTEDVVREIALRLGLVDVKVCAVDAVWSGLKLVVRRGQRRAARSSS